MDSSKSLLQVRGLEVEFPGSGEALRAVDGVDFDVMQGEALGIVGESGSGKTVLSLALMGLVPSPGRVLPTSQVVLDGELLGRTERDLRRVRGSKIAMVFQEPMSSLNPVHRVGAQIAEVLTLHRGLSRREASESAVDLLNQVEMPNPRSRAASFPHQLSGGMRQRAMIAMALAGNPSLLIADEPTTALDVTVQAQILDLIRKERERVGLALLLVTHDIGVMAELCERVLVMERGRVVESGHVSDVLSRPSTSYTSRLLEAIPTLFSGPDSHAAVGTAGGVGVPASDAGVGQTSSSESLVTVEKLSVRYGGPTGPLAVSDFDLTIEAGATMGLVGESGCGKSTLAKALVRLVDFSSGRICFGGEDVGGLRGRALRSYRTRAQIVFQDPGSSLNPRQTVGGLIEEALSVHGLGGPDAMSRRQRVLELLRLVALDDEHEDRFPHELSGGQRQRVGIARALAVEPDLLICDEAVSALDVSVQARILELLRRLQEQLGLTYLFISHDLAVVGQICDTVAIMYLGRVVEQGPVGQVFRDPKHPYTQTLLSAVPTLYRGDGPSADRIILGGDLPDPGTPPSGCPFHPRCFRADVGEDCRTVQPERLPVLGDPPRFVACHRAH